MNRDDIDTIKKNKELKDMLDRVKKMSNTDLIKVIKLRDILLTYDKTEKPEEKFKLLDELKYFCSWTFEYHKPANLKKIRKEEVKGADESSEEEDVSTRDIKDAIDT